MTNQIKERLLNEAKKHDDLQRFIDCVGWEDWMEEYISDPQYTDIYGLQEQDDNKINEVLKNIFNEAHKVV